MNKRNIAKLERALSASDKALTIHALDIAIAQHEKDLQKAADLHDFISYKALQSQYSKLSETRFNLIRS